MKLEIAEISLLGDREENQDRVRTVSRDAASLLIVIDGMGGHSNGARAAEVAIETIERAFHGIAQPIFDPQGFLHRTLSHAHANLVKLGADQAMEARPRATCAVCLVQDDAAFWAHVGDSRIYLLRGEQIGERTRDHSHVELLLQEGLITEEEVVDHPMRNFVECCLGGDKPLPGMTVTRSKPLNAGDTLLVCSDGLWSGLTEEQIAGFGKVNGALDVSLTAIGQQAVAACAPYADNTSAVALRCVG